MADVVATWAGVRPLLREEGDPSDVTRDYIIADGPPGLVTIAGGKLTTFRSMAEHLLDHVIEREGDRLPMQPAACRTTREPLLEGDASEFDRLVTLAVPELQEIWGLAEDAARRLVEVYGSEHARLLAHADGRPGLLTPLAPGCPVLAVETAYAAHDEMALTLEDFMRRRSGLTLFGDNGGLTVATAAARVMAQTLGWGPEETQRQLTAYRATVERMFAFRQDAEAGDGVSTRGAAI
jgi:glycerol-3-phosphate dehydrogenase